MDDWLALPFDDAARARAARAAALGQRAHRATQGASSRAPSAALTVEGEISNCKPWSSGHIYFTLKDDYAQIRAVMFRTNARAAQVRARRRHARRRARPAERLRGQRRVSARLRSDRAAWARARCRRRSSSSRRRLQAEGLFDAARKRPLPVLPRRIGVVTSLDGAALRDILRVLTVAPSDGARRHPAGARAGRRRGRRSRARARARSRASPERRRRHHRPRRRLGRGSVGVQRRARSRARSPRAPCP